MASLSHLPAPTQESARLREPEWGDEVTASADEAGDEAGGGADVVHVPGTPVARATWRQLHAADVLESPAAQAALVLAARVDANERETGSALASVVKQLTVSLAEALAGGQTLQEDPIERLQREWREQHHSS